MKQKPILYNLKSGAFLNLSLMVALKKKESKRKPPQLIAEMADGSSWLVAEGDDINIEQHTILVLCGWD